MSTFLADEWHHWWAIAPLWWALWLAAIVTVVWLVRRGRGRASDILAERFARGELSVDEYRERLDELRRS